jgi:putative flippase GtrA
MPGLAREQILFLLVGAWNTLFGIVIYGVLLKLFGHHVHYLIILIPAQILALTQAFILYRRLVFTYDSGDQLVAYAKFCLVSVVNALIGAALVWLLVSRLTLSPVAANALATCFLVVLSFIGHKSISFRRASRKAP